MTVNGTDSVVKGEIHRKSNGIQSDGSKVHRGMLKSRFFISETIVLSYNSNLAVDNEGSSNKLVALGCFFLSLFLFIQSIEMLYSEINSFIQLHV